MQPDSYHTRLHKFSSKPSGHDAARQRENQRRHRARVKDRIADLEALLASTQSRLDDALRRIESLTSEVQRLQNLSLQTAPQQQPVLDLVTCPQQEVVDMDMSESDSRVNSTPSALDVHVHPQPRVHATSSPTTHNEATPAAPQPITPATRSSGSASPQLSLPPKEPPAAHSAPTPSFDDPNDDCATLPAPSAGESTIPCREAYTILADHIGAPEFDLSAAAECLRPGFRRAVVPGTGCRVQTHVLFAFVDRITSF